MRVLAARRSSLGALMIQEHHARKGAVADLQAGAKARGFKLAANEATLGSGGGASAGVGVALPSHRGWGGILGPYWDFSPAESPGRIAGVWLEAGPRGGMVTLSVWCWPTEGMTTRNVKLIERALEVVVTSGCPWVIAGDFNATPKELVAAAGTLLDRAGGVVRAPEQATCYPALGRARTLDYFIVDSRIASAASQAEVDGEVVGSPHRAVRIRIRGREAGGLIRMVRKPRMLPRERPVGCARRPLVPRGLEGEEAGEGGRVSLEEEWRRLAYCVEGELCRECDRVGKDGAPDSRYLGRGEGLRLVLRPMLAPRAMARHGRADAHLHRLAWTLNRVEELIHLTGRNGGGWGDNTRRCQWEKVVFALGKTDGCTRKLAELDEEWRGLVELVESLQGRPRQGREALEGWATRIREAIDRQKGKVAEDRRRAWRDWVGVQIRRGGGALHSFTKRVVERAEEVLTVEGERTGSPQAHAEADRREWDKVWQRLANVATAPWREEEGEEGVGAALPTPTAGEMRRAGRRFKPFTGIGSDMFRPHWFSWLSDPLLIKLGELMVRIERVGTWPGQVMMVLVHLIPKEAGGRRPIGLLASVVRWWEKIRGPEVQRWRVQHARPFNWAAPGRSAEKAVWQVSLRDEAAAARGQSSASSMLDLVKAFEHIPLETLWKKGREHSFPLVILRLVLEMCAAPRRLVFRGAVSEPTATLTAVIAGLVIAIDCMYLMVIDALDRLRADFPQVKSIAYVDDLTLHRVGSEDEVRQDLAAATKQLVRELEEGCRLVVSKGKSGAVASTRKLRRKLRATFGKLGIGVGRKTKLLGVDYQPGGGRQGRREVQGKRWGRVAERRRRINRLGTQGGPHVVSTGVVHSAKYGATVTGPSRALVRELGAIAAGALGPMGGRSVWGRLGVRGMDHRIGLVLAPVRAWLEAVWEQEVDADDMLAAWRYAQRVTGLSARPHRMAVGAARSYVAALTRLGWQSPSVDAVLTREGHVMRVGEVDVTAIIRCAEDDLMAQMGLDSAIGLDINDPLGERGHYRVLQGAPPGAIQVTAEDGGAGITAHVAGTTQLEANSARVWRGARYQLQEGRMIPWLLPAVMTLKGRLRDKARRTAADGSAAALVEGGWWTAARLAAAGLRSTAICAACKEAIGTLWHRLGECSATKDEREGGKGCPQWLLRKGRVGLWDPLFSRGVPALPKVPAPPPQKVILTVIEEVGGEGGVATGDVYTDGAMTGRWRRIMRGGWGVVVLVDDAQRVAWRMHGTCAELYPSILRAELTAVLNVLRIVVPPARIHVDNAEVVRGFAEGPRWCTAVGRDGGDLWREVWERMDDIGGGVTVVKVKAHTEEGAVEEGIITERDRYGNMQADAEAKRGARLAESLSPIGVARGELVKGMRWMGWVRRYAAVWRADHEEEDGEGVREVRAAGEGGPRGKAAAGLRHLVWERGLEWKCRRCGRVASTNQKRKDLQSSRCLGSAMGRLLQRTCRDAEAVERCCLERGEDMLSRGWRPRGGVEGGEEGSGRTTRPFDEEDMQEGDDRDSEEEGRGLGEGGEVGERQADRGSAGRGQADPEGGGGGSNLAVAASAGGSGGATASAAAAGHAAAATPLRGGVSGPPAEEARRVRPRLWANEAHVSEPARVQTMIDVDPGLGGEAGGAGAAIDEELYDEDPFGHVAADLALQPNLGQAGPGDDARVQDGDAARRALHAHGGHADRDARGEAARRGGGEGADRLQRHGQGDQAARGAHGDGGSTRGTKRATTSDDAGRGKGRRITSGGGVPRVPASGPPEEPRGEKRKAGQYPPDSVPKRGRRYLSLVADPVDGADAGGHLLRVSGPCIWCSKCGRYAMHRLRDTLRGACGGEATGAYSTRLARLWEGRHPLTGEPLV